MADSLKQNNRWSRVASDEKRSNHSRNNHYNHHHSEGGGGGRGRARGGRRFQGGGGRSGNGRNTDGHRRGNHQAYDSLFRSVKPPTSEKPLLVLDLNGVLVHRGEYHKRGRGGRAIKKRPHCDEFIAFCLEHFEVGVWSCGKRNNMEMWLFDQCLDRLLFAFDNDKSLSQWPRSSIVATAKPLFLKNVTTVHDAYRSLAEGAGSGSGDGDNPSAFFGDHNTIILDNHLEKMEQNPHGTGLIVPEFAPREGDTGESDTLLAPDGEFMRILRELAVSSNPAEYIRSHAADCEFFPEAHPEPPSAEALARLVAAHEAEEKKDAQRRHQQQQRQQQQRQQQLMPPPPDPSRLLRPVQPSESEALKTHFLDIYGELTKGGQADRRTGKRADEIPGPRAITVRRRDLTPKLVGRTSDGHYVVCEKTDGVRYLLLMLPACTGTDSSRSSRSRAFLVDRSWSFLEIVGGGAYSDASGFTKPSVLDGELVHLPSASVFCVFDAMLLDGEDVGATPDLAARMRAIFTRVIEPLAKSPSPPGEVLPLETKVFVHLHQIGSIVQRIVHSSRPDGSPIMNFHSPDGRVLPCDGLVFTPVGLSYYDFLVYKWKPREFLTVDFAVSRDQIKTRGGGNVRVDGSLGNGPQKIRVAEVVLHRAQSQQLGQDRSGKKDFIIECRFDATLGWAMLHVRADKARPNSLRSGWCTLEAVAENLTTDELQQTFSSSCGNTAVAAHYDEIQRARRLNAGHAEDDRIFRLRRLNNWIKSVLLHRFCREQPHEDSSDGSSHAAHWASASAPGPGPGPGPIPEALLSFRRGGKSPAPRSEQTSILELACGRGGDIKKWTFLFRRIVRFVGVDVSTESLNEARSRAENLRRGRPSSLDFVEHDMSAADLCAAVAPRGERFDFISCQFALHYTCDSAARIDSWMRNVSALLTEGGHGAIVLTVPDWRLLAARCAESGCFGNDRMSVSFSEDMRARLLALPLSSEDDDDDDDDAAIAARWGIKYVFSLGDAVRDCTESVVHVPSLARVASRHGLAVSHFQDLGSFVRENCENSLYRPTLSHMQVVPSGADDGRPPLSASEWEATSLYAVLVLRRMK